MKTMSLLCYALGVYGCSSTHAPASGGGSDAAVDAATIADQDGSSISDGGAPVDAAKPVTGDAGTTSSNDKKVFVIALENQGIASVYGSSSAPYLASLEMMGGHASMYGDVLAPSAPSEPHYVWMEAGTNAFSDTTFTTDNDVSPSNSTASTAHLATQLGTLATPKTWRAYEEGLDSGTGTCPIASSGQYAAKHDPFVFFQDVSGSPPSKTNSVCVAHHKAFTVSGLEADLAANDVADYMFITPDLCNDMHGSSCTNGCLSSSTLSACVAAGDTWLQQIVPSILAYLGSHDGVLMIIWDEPETSGEQPFVIVGPHVKANYTSTVAYSHSSYLKSLQELLHAPVFSNVSSANDFADFYEVGYFP